MKYFIDTEFIEGFHKPLFGKGRHFIDLISIGIYCEDGRSYYAVSNGFNPKGADDWVKENVIDKIEAELFQQQSTYAKTHFNFSLKTLLKHYGKSNNKIAEEIISFVNSEKVETIGSIGGTHFLSEKSKKILQQGYTEPEFYGYYSDYDWVLFCSLFGRMIDLPKGFPMYCNDLKQTLDERVNRIRRMKSNPEIWTFEYQLDVIKTDPTYPKQENEHNALADAKWNYELYKFLNN